MHGAVSVREEVDCRNVARRELITLVLDANALATRDSGEGGSDRSSWSNRSSWADRSS